MRLPINAAITSNARFLLSFINGNVGAVIVFKLLEVNSKSFCFSLARFKLCNTSR